eukprot:318006_1
MYVIQADKKTINKLKLLNGHYVMSLHFDVFSNHDIDDNTGYNTVNNTVCTHLYYGLDEQTSRFRFFPEYLTKLIARFFKRNDRLNYYENVRTLYDYKYKHGFIVNLKDKIFNQYYKALTKWKHVSVNYDRNTMNEPAAEEKERQEYPYKNDDLKTKCYVNKILPIKKCPFIKYIIDSLTIFDNMDPNTTDINKFDLRRLTECSNHIISIHSFCLNDEQRKTIEQYVAENVGECKYHETCLSFKQHLTKKHDIKIQESQDILISCLNSLHVYLMHPGRTLFRIYGGDNNDGNFSRFLLAFDDEIDKFIEFIKVKTANETFITCLIDWMIEEEYDWDSMLDDINCNIKGNIKTPNQSNLFTFLYEKHSSALFDLIYEKYTDVDINAIDFGTSVLNWLEYGNKANHDSFEEELLSNGISPNKLKTYNEKCLILMKMINVTSNEYRDKFEYEYKRFELLTLKIYTDESKLCSEFRSAFWRNSKMRKKKEFYWWAINMYKTFLYHSKPLQRFEKTDKNPIKLFHGINKIFAVSERSPKYHGPVSTTSNETVAQQFSEDKDFPGLVWLIQTTYYNPFTFIEAISVAGISCHKNESEVLLHSQYLHITSRLNCANDDRKIDQLLKQLQVYNKKIVAKSMFWAQLGFKIDNTDTKFLSIICSHPLLLKHSKYHDKTILERLVEELEINALLDIVLKDKNKINHLLHQLKTFKHKITKQNLFWKQVGGIVNNDPELLSIIGKHSLFKEYSEYNKVIMFERLISELEIYKFTNIDTINDIINKLKTCQHKITLTKHPFWKQVSYALIHDATLTAQLYKHPLLFKPSEYKNETDDDNKIVLQRLVEELEVTQVLNYKDSIDYLLNQFKMHKKTITTSSEFWKRVGKTWNKSPPSISLIWMVLFEYSDDDKYDSLKGLVEVLGVNQLLNNKNVIYYLLNRLQKHTLKIDHKNTFWNQVGQTWNNEKESILIIREHPLLLKHSDYKVDKNDDCKTILERLVEELAIHGLLASYFEFLCFTGNLYVDRFDIVKVKCFHQKWQNIVPKYAFSIRNDSNDEKFNSSNKKFTFDDVNQFNISLHDKNTDFVYNLYVEPLTKATSSSMQLIKRFVKNRYIFNQTEPLYINKTINLTPFDKYYGVHGVIQIYCSSSIIIEETGKINGDECGFDREFTNLFSDNHDSDQKNDRLLLKYGQYIGDNKDNDEDNNKDNGFGGGIIELISMKEIVNKGEICCIGSSTYSSGIISIKCSQFSNVGTISGNKSITKSNFSSADFSSVCKPWKTRKEGKKIHLTIKNHRGHYRPFFHPNKLLDGDTNTCYSSNSPNGDWIKFNINSTSKPAIVKVRNNPNESGICCMSLFIACEMTNDTNDVEWYKLADITDMHNKSKEIQEFDISHTLTPYLWLKKNINTLKVTILKNYGSNSFNRFISFELWD